MELHVPNRTRVRFLRVLLSLPVLALLGAGTSAKADTYNYTAMLGSNTETFSLSSTAAPNSVFTAEGFVFDNIAVSVNGGAPTTEEIGFGNSSYPDLAIGSTVEWISGSEQVDNTLLASLGPTLYTGTESNPILSLGTFPSNFLVFISEDSSGAGTITVTDVSATPEPSSVALLGTGVLGVASVLRRRLAK